MIGVTMEFVAQTFFDGESSAGVAAAAAVTTTTGGAADDFRVETLVPDVAECLVAMRFRISNDCGVA
jgi:hypothetical protein